MTTRRASANIYDYPEHLNPFYEEDIHNKLRFRIVPKKKRSTSFSFQSVKDFKSNLNFDKCQCECDWNRNKVWFSCNCRTLGRFRSRSGTTCSMFTPSNHQIRQKSITSRTESGRRYLVFPKLLQIGRTFSIRKNKNDAPIYQPNQSTPKIEREKVQYQSPNPMKHFTINPKKQQSHYETVHTLPNPRLHERHRYNGDRVQPDSPSKSPNGDKNPFDVELRPGSSASGSPSSKPRTHPRKKKRAPPPPPVRQSSLQKDSTEGTSTESVNEQQDEQSSEENKRDSVSTSHSENIKQNEKKIEETEKITVTTTFNRNEADEENTESNIASNEETNEHITTDSITITNTNRIEETKEIQVTKLSVVTNEQHSVCTQKNEASVDASESTTVDITQIEETSKQGLVEEGKVVENASKDENITELAGDIIIVESTDITENATESKELENDTICIPDQLIYNSELTISGSNTSLSSDIQLEQKHQQLAIEDSSDLLEMVQKLQLEVQKLTDDTNNNEIPTSPKVKTEMTVHLGPDSPTAPLSPRFIRLRKDNAWIKRYE